MEGFHRFFGNVNVVDDESPEQLFSTIRFLIGREDDLVFEIINNYWDELEDEWEQILCPSHFPSFDYFKKFLLKCCEKYEEIEGEATPMNWIQEKCHGMIHNHWHHLKYEHYKAIFEITKITQSFLEMFVNNENLGIMVLFLNERQIRRYELKNDINRFECVENEQILDNFLLRKPSRKILEEAIFFPNIFNVPIFFQKVLERITPTEQILILTLLIPNYRILVRFFNTVNEEQLQKFDILFLEEFFDILSNGPSALKEAEHPFFCEMSLVDKVTFRKSYRAWNRNSDFSSTILLIYEKLTKIGIDLELPEKYANIPTLKIEETAPTCYICYNFLGKYFYHCSNNRNTDHHSCIACYQQQNGFHCQICQGRSTMRLFCKE